MSPHVRSVARLGCAILAAALLPLAANAQAAPTDSLVARADRVFAGFTTNGSPGCAVGLARDGQPPFTRAYGAANLEYGVPLTPESILESGSVAKQFTAAAIVLLALDGKLALDDDARRYIPELPRFGRTITVRHLLTHTSGLRDQWGLLGIEGRGPGTQVHSATTTLDLVSHQKALNFPPGSEYLYSNTGFTLLGVIVERVSGQSLAEFTRRRLFEPLGMTHTRWRDDFTRIVPARATAYEGTAASGFRQEMPFTNIVGNGGLLTTVGDLLRWNENFVDARVGGRAFVDSMLVRGRLTSGRTIGYALGLAVGHWRGVSEVSHSGSTAGYRAFLARYPDQHVSVAVLCNLASANPTALAHELVEPMIPVQTEVAQSSSPGVNVPQRVLDGYAGSYADRRTDRMIQLVAGSGKLELGEPAGAANDLTAIAADRFRMRNGNEIIMSPPTSSSRAFLLVSPDADTARFESVGSPDTRLEAYAGTYTSNELDVRLVITVDSGRLVLRRRPADVIPLRAQYLDDFMAPGVGSLRFTRDSSGRVTGFGIFAGRVRNVRYERRA